MFRILFDVALVLWIIVWTITCTWLACSLGGCTKVTDPALNPVDSLRTRVYILDTRRDHTRPQSEGVQMSPERTLLPCRTVLSRVGRSPTVSSGASGIDGESRPLVPAVRTTPTDEEKFWSRVVVSENCWEWRGARNPNGYGNFYADHKRISAHRWAYEHFIGAIPNGLTLDHLCRNRACVNPHHLEAVTLRTNILRGTSPSAIHAVATHCVNGHPLTGSNLYVTERQRYCRACWKLRRLKSKETRE